MKISSSTADKQTASIQKKKHLGQNFLEDRNILELEVKLADISGKNVLEIGPGDGRLTRVLLAQKPKKLTIVEKDPRFVEILKEKFGRKEYEDSIQIIETDFLELDLSKLEFDVVIGNIPYYISSPIIFKLANYKFEHAVLMVQREFAQKMIQKPGSKSYGRLSVTSQLAFDVKIERIVSRQVFKPTPRVDSALIILKPTGRKLTEFDENIIRYLFQHKNKTVRNALLDSKEFDKTILEKIGPFAERRARTLTKEECLEIAKLLYER
ncbi:ribosomal RNA small subunit methyltransferase A [Candidatus Micrarchaeota archaeon]|nr:ribosomal RNA small subunit methyltransferase A [Candidatus Micrarchaeota archaeon]